MKRESFWAAILLISVVSPQAWAAYSSVGLGKTDNPLFGGLGSLFFGAGGNRGGGTDCAACTVVIGLLEQMGELDDGGIEAVVDKVCDFFPSGVVQDACKYVIDTYGDDIIKLVVAKETADEICSDLKVCTLFPECRLFSPPDLAAPGRVPAGAKAELLASLTFEKKLATGMPPLRGLEVYLSQRVGAARAETLMALADPLLRAPGMNPWEWLKHLINVFANLHEPIVDLDADKFGTKPTLRGTSWRGGDCDDFNADVYPGRNSTTHGPDVDHNCNAIVGVNPDTGVSWEEELCGGQPAYTVVGGWDSAAAHFRIPIPYLNAASINHTTYRTHPDILWRLENEFDLPFGSSSSGFVNTTADDTVRSVYEYVLRKNLCSFNAFQNVGVNGARSGAVANGDHPLMWDVAADQAADQPVIFIYGLVGNDVCSSNPSVAHMTTVEEFKTNIETTLTYYDTVLPAGSHILFLGLAPGTILYDAMHNRTHPISPSRSGLPGEVPYTQLYEFLNCLDISPCAGWLSNNATTRANTQTHANALSATFPQIIAENTYKNFDMMYVSFVELFQELIVKWEADGGEAWQLITQTDSFHPNSMANDLIGEALVEKILEHNPQWFGSVNPNNAKIAELFGNNMVYKWSLN